MLTQINVGQATLWHIDVKRWPCVGKTVLRTGCLILHDYPYHSVRPLELTDYSVISN